jgi:transcriptional repressor NrdR
MKCPFCSHLEDMVVDSRSLTDGAIIRRRRECLKCQHRYTTYERVEETPLKVIKKDGRREDYDRHKLMNGIVKACEKRPVSMEQIENIVQDLEQKIEKEGKRETSSKKIGELVMKKLYKVDEVAYVRFASVYRQFKDISQFMHEVKGLLGK